VAPATTACSTGRPWDQDDGIEHPPPAPLGVPTVPGQGLWPVRGAVPASAVALGAPDDLGESPLIQLDPEETAPEAWSQGADGSGTPEPETPMLPN